MGDGGCPPWIFEAASVLMRPRAPRCDHTTRIYLSTVDYSSYTPSRVGMGGVSVARCWSLARRRKTQQHARHMPPAPTHRPFCTHRLELGRRSIRRYELLRRRPRRCEAELVHHTVRELAAHAPAAVVPLATGHIRQLVAVSSASFRSIKKVYVSRHVCIFPCVMKTGA